MITEEDFNAQKILEEIDYGERISFMRWACAKQTKNPICGNQYRV